MQRRVSRLAPFVLLLSPGCTVQESPLVSTDGTTVTLQAGAIAGAFVGEDQHVRVFKGIPFAAPPLGERRWQPPYPVEPWEGIRDATTFSSSCVQPTRSQGSSRRTADAMSEDCLYLNVWTAAAPNERRPVMVWIHGGGLRTGSGSDASYDGEALARRGVVLVTINYRLGPFGFLAHPLLREEFDLPSSSGNYGILDQVAALRWIQENIAALGGDPDRVTIFGEAAGSWSINYLLATPLAKGMFHRAIGESGGAFGSLAAPVDRALAEAHGERLATVLMGYAAAVSLEAMRAKITDEVEDATRAEGVPYMLLPNVDGWVFHGTVYDVFTAGTQNDVPVIVGSNADEDARLAGRRPDDVAAYVRYARDRYGEMSDEFLDAYPATTSDEVRRAFLRSSGDRDFGWEMRTWGRLMANVSSPAYLYFFSRVPPGSERGAYHTAEIRYVFGNLDGAATPYAQTDHQLSDLMVSYWVNFATIGDPNGEGLPEWPVYTEDTDQAMEFGDAQGVRRDIRKAGLDFFDRYFAAMRAAAAK